MQCFNLKVGKKLVSCCCFRFCKIPLLPNMPLFCRVELIVELRKRLLVYQLWNLERYQRYLGAVDDNSFSNTEKTVRYRYVIISIMHFRYNNGIKSQYR